MHKAVGNVEYDKDAALYPGLVYEPCDTYPTGGATELMLLDLEDVTEDSDDDVKPEKMIHRLSTAAESGKRQ